MTILPIHERLAELWIIRGSRDLTKEEQADFEHCLSVNAKHIRQIAHLHNLSLAASMAGDAAWQQEISLRREKLIGQPPRSS
ncbi:MULTISPECIES: hypothetical protein [unclassified Paenibacillus]|uniref:DUF7667 family protein n=1 Tax=unclassified Paenibacillus TaxID=185978 RepID=UPI0010E2CFA7|nr:MULTISPECIES: hypothetical protein [unclassified Paenibacillus]NIK66599.1 hypothetical protein [Paenibacillus sp. BK720]TCN00576.1 hypothetical protein EV294_10124 [Paenibacillus sp. BK033]